MDLHPAPRAETLPAAADTAAVPSVAPQGEGRWQRLDPRSIALGRLTGWIGTAVMLFVYSAFTGFLWLPMLVGRSEDAAWLPVALTAGWPILFAALAWRAHAFPELHYRHTTWRIDEIGLTIRTGVVWRVEISVARSRVQHIDVSQGPLERRFGLATLAVYTAGTEHSQVTLDGLEHGVALAARDRLLPARDADAV